MSVLDTVELQVGDITAHPHTQLAAFVAALLLPLLILSALTGALVGKHHSRGSAPPSPPAWSAVIDAPGSIPVSGAPSEPTLPA